MTGGDFVASAVCIEVWGREVEEGREGCAMCRGCCGWRRKGREGAHEKSRSRLLAMVEIRGGEGGSLVSERMNRPLGAA